MATPRGKDATLKKEKVTPSSDSHTTTHRQGIAKPSIAKDKSSTPSTKPIPSYLRPTISSRPEVSKPAVKKFSNEDAPQKQILRRRSFDKPPSAARVHSSLVSPGPAERPRPRSRDKALTTRSSSFQSRPVTKPALDSTMSPKSVKSQLPTAKTVRRSTAGFLKNAGPSSKNVSKGSVSQSAPSSHDSDTEKKEHIEIGDSSLVNKTEVSVNVDTEVQVPKEHVDSVDTQVDPVEDNKLNIDAELPVEETESKLPEEQTEKPEENHHKEVIIEEAKAEDFQHEQQEENENANANENTASPEESTEEKNHEEEEKGDQGSEEVKPEEEQDPKGQVEEEKAEPEAANIVIQKRPMEKKESPAAYNDVIEETKNKLLEARKNKVKALVGAFETVIDYESAGSGH